MKKLVCCIILAISAAMSIVGLTDLSIINAQEKMNEKYSKPNYNLTWLLGEPIYKELGRDDSSSVVLDDEGSIKTEDSYTATGFLNGVGNVTDIAKFVTTYYPDDNTTSSTGHGIIMTHDGEMATYAAQDLGVRDINGTETFRGIQIFQTDSGGKLEFIDNLIGLYEYKIWADGKRTGMIWEWK